MGAKLRGPLIGQVFECFVKINHCKVVKLVEVMQASSQCPERANGTTFAELKQESKETCNCSSVRWFDLGCGDIWKLAIGPGDSRQWRCCWTIGKLVSAPPYQGELEWYVEAGVKGLAFLEGFGKGHVPLVEV